MGSVWRAEHVELGTPVAVKLIDPAIAMSPEATARFKREAQAAAALRSTHVVQVLDYGIDDQTPYIVMELLEGESLADRMARVRQLSPETLVDIFTQVGRALARAHERNIVHRDLKPDNIFLVREGDADVAKVLDFGIAKAGGSFSTTGGLQTRTGAMLGTPYYMSPEQASGKRGVDFRSDLWSLGIIAFECLTGARPFEADTLGGIVLAICAEPILVPSQVASVPAGFDAWFARVTERDPDRRFQSVSEMVSALSVACGMSMIRTSPLAVGPTMGVGDAPARAAMGSQALDGTVAPASVTMGQTPGLPRSRPMLWVGLGVAAVGIIGAAVFFSRGHSTVANEASASSSLGATPVPSVASPTPVVSATEPAVIPVVPVASIVPVASASATAVGQAAAPETRPSGARRGGRAGREVAPVNPTPAAAGSVSAGKKRTLEERVGF